ncbi:MAG: polysaccharide deacetylase [Oscillospiraceae bacterium]|nr:polysaccharide deacetylase [Oscillospiraceae bacterium]
MSIRLKRAASLTAALSILFCLSAALSAPDRDEGRAENPYKIYLTFDDGPSWITEKALDTLKAHGVKATFFVTGQTSESRVALYRRILSEGHALGLHSYTHATRRIYASADHYIEDFERLRDWIFLHTGQSPKICRMVGGSRSRLVPKAERLKITEYFRAGGYAAYDWDIDPLDSGAYPLGAGAIAKNVIRDARKKDEQDLVILLHDDGIRKTLPAALDIIIPYFLERGYAFGALEAGTVLNSSRAPVS